MATKTITSLYDTYEDAAATVSELKAANVPAGDINLVASQARKQIESDEAEGNMADTGVGQGAAIGGVLGGGAGLLAGLGALTIPGLGPVVGAGWLITTAIGAALGASGGGIVGALIGAGVSEEHAHIYAESVRRGGSLVTVRVESERAAQVEAIMSRRAVSADIKGEEYRRAGWDRFDPDAPPYTVETEREVRVERRTPPINPAE